MHDGGRVEAAAANQQDALGDGGAHRGAQREGLRHGQKVTFVVLVSVLKARGRARSVVLTFDSTWPMEKKERFLS